MTLSMGNLRNMQTDFLSRLLVNTAENEEEVNFSFIDEIPINSGDIAEATRNDFVLNGWPNHVNDIELKPYFT